MMTEQEAVQVVKKAYPEAYAVITSDFCYIWPGPVAPRGYVRNCIAAEKSVKGAWISAADEVIKDNAHRAIMALIKESAETMTRDQFNCLTDAVYDSLTDINSEADRQAAARDIEL